MTRQGEWAKKYRAVPVPAAIKDAVQEYAEHEGLKLYKALEFLLKENPKLQPYLKEARA